MNMNIQNLNNLKPNNSTTYLAQPKYGLLLLLIFSYILTIGIFYLSYTHITSQYLLYGENTLMLVKQIEYFYNIYNIISSGLSSLKQNYLPAYLLSYSFPTLLKFSIFLAFIVIMVFFYIKEFQQKFQIKNGYMMSLSTPLGIFVSGKLQIIEDDMRQYEELSRVYKKLDYPLNQRMVNADFWDLKIRNIGQNFYEGFSNRSDVPPHVKTTLLNLFTGTHLNGYGKLHNCLIQRNNSYKLNTILRFRQLPGGTPLSETEYQKQKYILELDLHLLRQQESEKNLEMNLIQIWIEDLKYSTLNPIKELPQNERQLEVSPDSRSSIQMDLESPALLSGGSVKEEIIALVFVLLNSIVLSLVLGIVLAVYSNWLLSRFPNLHKYPKIKKLIENRLKIQKWIFKVNLIWVFIGIWPQLYIILLDIICSNTS
uniref:Uncharacterized protein n=1 Tax=Termitomyces sp. TaxID=1916073 RepID=A0A386TYI1_9AGAR|nr:hypothetical protein C0988_000015 [Termitomyces sp.]